MNKLARFTLGILSLGFACLCLAAALLLKWDLANAFLLVTGSAVSFTLACLLFFRPEAVKEVFRLTPPARILHTSTSKFIIERGLSLGAWVNILAGVVIAIIGTVYGWHNWRIAAIVGGPILLLGFVLQAWWLGVTLLALWRSQQKESRTDIARDKR